VISTVNAVFLITRRITEPKYRIKGLGYMFDTLEKAVGIVEKIHSKIIIYIFALLTLVLTGAVIARNTGIPIMWTDELSRILFVWIIFLSSAIAVRRGGHLSLDLLKDLFNSKLVIMLIHLVGIFILGLLVRPIWQMIELGATSFTSMLQIPWSYLYLPFMFFVLLSIFYHAAEIILSLKQL